MVESPRFDAKIRQERTMQRRHLSDAAEEVREQAGQWPKCGI